MKGIIVASIAFGISLVGCYVSFHKNDQLQKELKACTELSQTLIDQKHDKSE